MDAVDITRTPEWAALTSVPRPPHLRGAESARHAAYLDAELVVEGRQPRAARSRDPRLRRGRAGFASRAGGCGPALPARALHGRTIVVVDDEPAVRAGLQALLGGWGAQVLAFASLPAVQAWADGVDGVAERPDLLPAVAGWGFGASEQDPLITGRLEEMGVMGGFGSDRLWIDGVPQTGEGTLLAGNIQAH